MEGLVGRVVAGRYHILKPIGRGSFGEIFHAVDLENDSPVGVKVELADLDYPQLVSESRIYDELKGGAGIPHIYWFGTESEHNFLVMDLLGESCESLLVKNGGRFSLKTVLLIGHQMISRIEYLHKADFIHRDIKPENFVVGTGSKKNFIYIIDYGLCKKFRFWRTGTHIPYLEGKALTGTARYASLNTHLGIEQSRRDDLEGLAYVLIYFLKGKLPWQDIAAKEKQDRYEIIKTLKQTIPVEEICEGLPLEYCEFLRYCRSLQFEQAPDYNYIKGLFENLRTRLKYDYDYIYDWTVLEETKRK
jgi:serine/threonine protein kinase